MTKTKLSLVFLCLTAIGAVLFVVASAQSDPAPTTPALSSFTFSRDLSMGDTGPDVSVLQGFLISDGFLDISTSTGYFGPLTEAAVANWQASVELPDTGYFGPLSRAAMAIVSASPYGRDLTIGDTGSDVSMLQNFLISKEFLTIATATGYFGVGRRPCYRLFWTAQPRSDRSRRKHYDDDHHFCSSARDHCSSHSHHNGRDARASSDIGSDLNSNRHCLCDATRFISPE
jgi:peptidoglycan hydrolase-like protein with peptidoglycan-binding domain